MKLIIQIPCFNEEDQLPATLADLPARARRHRRGRVADHRRRLDRPHGRGRARQHGVDHIVRLTNNKGLAAGFQAGLDACLKLGADLIVNTDADNQYNADDIPKLLAPILRRRRRHGGGRPRGGRTSSTSRRLKVSLQHLGSAVVRRASETNVPDTTSGFRAYNREAAIQLQVVSKFTYTLETIIQAGKNLVAVDHVPIRTNPKTRESRLFPSMWSYVRRNGVSIFRIYSIYEPLRVFMAAAGVVGLVAAVIWARFACFYIVEGEGKGHVQSLILGAVLFIAAVQLAALGVIGDILAGEPRAPAAHARARAARRAAARRRAVALRAGRAADGDRPSRRPAPTPGPPPARPRTGRR